jgi:hypothetical protein
MVGEWSAGILPAVRWHPCRAYYFEQMEDASMMLANRRQDVGAPA